MVSIDDDILDAARYLRSVRPIDPVELVDYTTEPAAPEAITAILRDHALELELVERDDGTFVPVSEDPIPDGDIVLDRLPTDLEHLINHRLGGGVDSWAGTPAGDELRDRIRDLKSRYLDGGRIAYDRRDADAYLAYHFPRSYAATRYTLAEIVQAGLLPRSLRVVDVGAGVGAHLAAVDDGTPTDALIDYIAIEPSPLADHFEAVAESSIGRNTHVTLHRQGIEDVDIGEPVDLAILGNVLSELDTPDSVASRILDAVAADGTWLAIAPADRRTSLQLRTVERALEDEAAVFSPTIRLWPHRRPTDDCWSFVDHPSLAVPRFQERLASAADTDAGAYVNASIRFSYSIMRPDGTRRFDVTATEAEVLPLERTPDAIGERVDAMVVKLSGDLADGTTPVYRVGDGSQTEPCFAVHVAPTVLNEALDSAPYGAVLRMERALVLWNDDEHAINLVVDDEATVAQLAP